MSKITQYISNISGIVTILSFFGIGIGVLAKTNNYSLIVPFDNLITIGFISLFISLPLYWISRKSNISSSNQNISSQMQVGGRNNRQQMNSNQDVR